MFMDKISPRYLLTCCHFNGYKLHSLWW